MSIMNEFPKISSNLGAGLGVYGTADPYNSTQINNGALNPPGSVSCIPSPSQSSTALQTSKGYGSFLWIKYCLYKSTGNPSTVGGPAPVYYTDETMTIVSGVSTESIGGITCCAGWLLPSTVSTGAGSGFTNTVLNNGGNGSYVWIGLAGFIPGAISATSVVAGDGLVPAATNFAVARAASPTIYNVSKLIGIALTAVSGGLSDIIAQLAPF